jgi:hypothetical protein
MPDKRAIRLDPIRVSLKDPIGARAFLPSSIARRVRPLAVSSKERGEM